MGVPHGEHARLSSFDLTWERKTAARWRGSGTIFFARCNLRCQYCQNHDISQTDNGMIVDAHQLAAIMLELQEYGCHNINFVSPTHVVAPILGPCCRRPSGIAHPAGVQYRRLRLTRSLTLLDGVIDIICRT
jgi:putative pyruvate formate lyase activating enzyme